MARLPCFAIIFLGKSMLTFYINPLEKNIFVLSVLPCIINATLYGRDVNVKLCKLLVSTLFSHEIYQRQVILIEGKFYANEQNFVHLDTIISFELSSRIIYIPRFFRQPRSSHMSFFLISLFPPTHIVYADIPPRYSLFSV